MKRWKSIVIATMFRLKPTTDDEIKETHCGPTATMDDDENDGESPSEKFDTAVTIDDDKPKRLYYRIGDVPPLHLTMAFGLQEVLSTITGTLSVSMLVAELICARDDHLIKSRILSSTMLMAGITTFLMATVGVRLPIFQGPTPLYIIPLLALGQMDEWRCPTQDELAKVYANSTSNSSLDSRGLFPIPTDVIYGKISSLMGTLMVVGLIHALIGATGLVGLLLRIIGPITIIPAMLLLAFVLYKPYVMFAETQWGVAVFTSGLGIIMSLYLRNLLTPLPAWSRSKGFHIIRFPLHQVFAALLAIVCGWILAYILTTSGVLSDDPMSVSYYARTDSRNSVISQSSWFYFPYPGQFGPPSFSMSAFMAFIITTCFSVLESIGDYNACARMCFVPPPPTHAVNRGIVVEGFMSFIAGTFGIGHGTASYSHTIGIIGLTRVASRRVLQAAGIIFILMAIVGKIGAFFATIPYCVIGGAAILGLGNFIGVILSNLQYIDLNSSRNLAIVGISMLVGMMLPHWMEKTPNAIQTGIAEIDRLFSVILSNAICIGGLIACFLDNTVPGTRVERGLHIWQQKYTEAEDATSGPSDIWEEGMEVYKLPYLPEFIKRSKIIRFIPFIPDYKV